MKRLLSLALVLLFPVQTGAFSQSSLPPQDARLLLPEGALELPAASCASGVQQVTMVELPVERCIHLPQPAEKTFQQLETQLLTLGYNESYHLTERGLIMSRWAESGTPERQVAVAVMATRAPLEGSVLMLLNPAAGENVSGAASAQSQAPRETWADGLDKELEPSRRDNQQTLSLAQEGRVRLPDGALKLPSTVCEQALLETTYIEAPLLGCYHLTQTYTQVREHLGNALSTLGYKEGYVDEASTFNATNWWTTEITRPVLGTVNAYSETFGGSLLFELDYREAQ